MPRVDELRAQQKLDGKPTPEQLERLKQVKEELRTAEEGLAAAEAARDAALGKVPNLPHESAADGDRDEDAIVVKEWGEPKTPEHAPEHLELASYDMERGAKVSGARFGFIVGDAARLSLALYRLALDRLTAERVHARAAAGARARGGDVRHGVLPVREERLLLDPRGRPLPRRDVRGAADRDAHGRDPRAAADPLLRVLVVLPPRVGRRRAATRAACSACTSSRRWRWSSTSARRSRGTSTSGCSRSRRRSCRRSGCRTASSTARRATSRRAAAKRYDIEAWFPSQERYREITSCSNTTDYQARRSGIRFRAGEKQLETPHTLNGTAVTDRWALAILENFGGDVPEVLQGYGAPARVTK